MLNLAGDSAVIPACGLYRYRLDLHIGAGSTVVGAIGCNPSMADGRVDDATVRRLRGFGKRLGWGRVVVGNVFGWRATVVDDLATTPDPIGPKNAEHIEAMLRDVSPIVAF